MKILAPLDNPAEIEALIRAGAGELYCSVISQKWMEKYSIAAISRRPALICNFKSFDELKHCTDIAHCSDISVCLAVNEHYYTQEQYPFLLEYIHEAVDAGVDSFMIADVGLLLLLKEEGIDKKTYISTGGTVFNSESSRFYQSLGASGITMPRHLTIDEIRKIKTDLQSLETSVFIMNWRCPNVDGLCTFMHIQSSDPSYKNACQLPFSVSLKNTEIPDGEAQPGDQDSKCITACVRQHVWERYHVDDFPCGLCALYEFYEMGIDSVKIVGRGNPVERKVRDIELIRGLLSYLREGKFSRDDFRGKVRRLYTINYNRPCRTIMCYYPEVMAEQGKQL